MNLARIIEDHEQRISIRAETEIPAVLVINDAFLPQWSAQIDGVDAPVLRVNYCFRGIYLDEGLHIVELSYNPWRGITVP